MDIINLALSTVRKAVGLPTPEAVVEGMLGLLPSDFWKTSRHILEVNVKGMSFYDKCKEYFKSIPFQYTGVVLDDGLCFLYSHKYADRDFIAARTAKEMEDKVVKLSDAKFDLVVGNPPYNRGMYMDFVRGGAPFKQ